MPARSNPLRSRALLLLALLPALLARAPALAAQGDESEHSTPWRLSYFPYIAGMANDGPAYFLRARYWQPAEYEASNTYTAALDGAVGATFEGSRLAAVAVPRARPVEGLAARCPGRGGATGPLRLFRSGEQHRAGRRPGDRRDALPLPGPPDPV